MEISYRNIFKTQQSNIKLQLHYITTNKHINMRLTQIKDKNNEMQNIKEISLQVKMTENQRTKDHCNILQPPMKLLNQGPSSINPAPACNSIVTDFCIIFYFSLFFMIFGFSMLQLN